MGGIALVGVIQIKLVDVRTINDFRNEIGSIDEDITCTTCRFVKNISTGINIDPVDTDMLVIS